MLSRINLIALLTASALAVTGCASSSSSSYSPMADANSVGRYKVGKPYTVNGKTFYPTEIYSGTQRGTASWYGPGFDGRQTANGERFDQNALTAAHPTLQMPSLVRVTNLQNNRTVIVRVNDRGPFHGGRIIDLSKGAAEALGFRNMGTAEVQLDVLTSESIVLAEAAKRKIDTRGAEIAMNQTGQLDSRFAMFYPTTVAQPQDTALAMNGYVPDGSGYVPQVPAETALVAAPLGVPQNINQETPIQDTLPQDGPRAPVVAESVLPPINTGAPVHAAASAPVPPQMPVERVASTYQMAPVPESHTPVPPAAPARGLLGRLTIGPSSAIAAEMPAAAGSHFVQVGAYLSKGSAEVLSEQLSQFGETAVVPARPNDTAYFRVRIGPFESAEKADYIVDSLKSQGRMAMVVASH